MTNSTTGGFSRNTVIIIAVIAFALGAGVGVGAWILVRGGSGEPSRDVADLAPTLARNTPVPATNAPATDVPTLAVTIQPTTDPSAPTATPIPPTAGPTIAATVQPSPTTGAAAQNVAPTGEQTIFTIVKESSLVTFTMQEDLRGTRTEVVGTTREVAGEVLVDFGNPSNSQVGGIVINARTLQTDQSFRNSAIRGEILLSSQAAYEFITFTPTRLEGLPGSVAVGDTLTFKIVGDLKIIETTLPVTFDATVTVTSATEISGSASAIVKWADWGIRIPSVPGVANITEEVTLKIEFVARAE
jgi:polyisoprenoid-binding protein YceI